METEKELDILEHIYHNQDSVRQRDLAHIAGVSLGMINVVLKRLTQKGWIQIKKVNNRNIQYVVSPEGIDAISHRSYSFFKRTIKNLVYYKDILEALILEIKHKGYHEIVLVGPSQVDFLVEHFCVKYGLSFCNYPVKSREDGVYDTSQENLYKKSQINNNSFFLYSEEIIPCSEKDKKRVVFSFSERPIYKR